MNFPGTGQSSGRRAGGDGTMGTLWEVRIWEVPCDVPPVIRELDDKEQEILLHCLDPGLKLQAQIHVSSFHLDFPFPHSCGMFDKEFRLTKTTDVFFSGQDNLCVLKIPGFCVKGNVFSVPVPVLLYWGAGGAKKRWISVPDVDCGSSFIFLSIPKIKH